MTAREAALAVVRDVFPVQPATERTAQEALDYRIGKAHLDRRDRAFATMLAFGSIKMRRTLEWYLRTYVGDRAKPLAPAIAEILRLAVYELRFASTPERAVVSEWVGIAKRLGHRGTAGLVNAVLRSLLRDDPAPPQRGEFEDEDEYLGTLHSYPTWIVRQLRGVFGEERLTAILEACNAPAQPAAVVNRAMFSRDALVAYFAEHEIRSESSVLAQDAVLLDDGASARALEREANGRWWLQSESSAMVVDVLNPQPGERVIDVCSGRGSKALQSAARLAPESGLVCIERDPRKASVLEQRAAQAGLAPAIVVADALATPADLRGDRILVDAPCSGIGVIGRHPEARWRKRPGDGERLAATQRDLLNALAPRLYEGGAIVYAVCSTDPRETREVVEWFRRAHNVERGLLPAALSEFLTGEGDLLIPPGLRGRDGFFIARLERRL